MKAFKWWAWCGLLAASQLLLGVGAKPTGTPPPPVTEELVFPAQDAGVALLEEGGLNMAEEEWVFPALAAGRAVFAAGGGGEAEEDSSSGQDRTDWILWGSTIAGGTALLAFVALVAVVEAQRRHRSRKELQSRETAARRTVAKSGRVGAKVLRTSAPAPPPPEARAPIVAATAVAPAAPASAATAPSEPTSLSGEDYWEDEEAVDEAEEEEEEVEEILGPIPAPSFEESIRLTGEPSSTQTTTGGWDVVSLRPVASAAPLPSERARADSQRFLLPRAPVHSLVSVSSTESAATTTGETTGETSTYTVGSSSYAPSHTFTLSNHSLHLN